MCHRLFKYGPMTHLAGPAEQSLGGTVILAEPQYKQAIFTEKNHPCCPCINQSSSQPKFFFFFSLFFAANQHKQPELSDYLSYLVWDLVGCDPLLAISENHNDCKTPNNKAEGFVQCSSYWPICMNFSTEMNSS